MNITGIKRDYEFLVLQAKKNYCDILIQDYLELRDRKKIYKKEEGYSEFKREFKQLRRFKIPFRMVEVIREALADGRPVPDKLKDYVPDDIRYRDTNANPLTEEDIKRAAKFAENAFIKTYKDASPELLIFTESLLSVHGTNSSILPMLPHTGYKMTCTGDLLDQGKAPMSGEIELGGMKTDGVNQNHISTETVRNLNRSWNYAKKVSLSFKSEEYEDAESLFVEELESLEKLTPQDHQWDSTLISLYRIKQWQPEAFSLLCAKYAKKIEAIKIQVKASCSEREMYILKALDYDLEKLKEARTNEEVRRQIIAEFGGHLEFAFHFESWLDDPSVAAKLGPLSLTYFAMSQKFESRFHNEFTGILNSVLRLRMLGEEELKYLEEHLEDDFLYPHILKRIKKEAGDPPDMNKLLDLWIRKKVENRIQHNLLPFKRRHDRLVKLFDESPSINLDSTEKEMIVHPFPLMIGSTTVKSQNILSQEEFNIKEAEFGKGIDLIFLKKKHFKQMREWLAEHGLTDKVTLIASSAIRSISKLPGLYHAPSQILCHDRCLNITDYKMLARSLNDHIVPLYRKSYPDGSQRKHHGVAHGIGAVFFAAIHMEMYHEKGYRFEGEARDLLFAMGGHDTARETDYGEDLWDAESGEITKQALITHFNRSEKVGEKYRRINAEKDSDSPFCLELEPFHDGDCVEIIRCLENPHDFVAEKLWLLKRIDADAAHAYINEAKEFIRLRESPKIKAFIENSPSPLAAYYQILHFAYQQHKKFPILAAYGYAGMDAFCGGGNYLLSPEIEETITQFFLTKT